MNPADAVRSVAGVFVAVGHDPRTELVKGRAALDAARSLRACSYRAEIPRTAATDRNRRRAST
jgi:hypothetical protein